jgi:ribosomal protein S18 acetylase RimI-like enzyme
MFTLRPAAQPADAAFLAAMLVEAINWNPDRPRRAAQDLLGEPEIARYVAGWPRSGDLGVVAEEADGRRIGACWLRFFAAAEPGYGFVAPDVPEVSLAVVSAWRGRGVGRALLRELGEQARAAGIARLSLSVERANRAIDLYRSEGYVVVAADAETATLVKELGAGITTGRSR